MSDLGNKEIMAENIQRFMELRKVSRNDVCKAIGVKYTTLTDWIKGKTYPRIDKIEKLAIYFGVSKSDLVEKYSEPKPSNVSVPNVRAIPILGNICAGNGVFCEENYSGTFYADDSIKADVCVRVHGDSMVDAGIYDGDMAFIRETADYENGKIYAVLINSDIEAVLKKVTWDNDRVVLNPCNSTADYTPLIQPINEVYIVGECVGIYHPTV